MPSIHETMSGSIPRISKGKKGMCLGVGRVTDILRLSGIQASPCVLQADKYSILLLKKNLIVVPLIIFSIKICLSPPPPTSVLPSSQTCYTRAYDGAHCSFLKQVPFLLFFLSSRMTFPFFPWGLVPGKRSLKNGWLLSLYSCRTFSITSLWDTDNKISVMQMLYGPARCELLRTKNRHYINVWMIAVWTIEQSVLLQTLGGLKGKGSFKLVFNVKLWT